MAGFGCLQVCLGTHERSTDKQNASLFNPCICVWYAFCDVNQQSKAMLFGLWCSSFVGKFSLTVQVGQPCTVLSECALFGRHPFKLSQPKKTDFGLFLSVS